MRENHTGSSKFDDFSILLVRWRDWEGFESFLRLYGISQIAFVAQFSIVDTLSPLITDPKRELSEKSRFLDIIHFFFPCKQITSYPTERNDYAMSTERYVRLSLCVFLCKFEQKCEREKEKKS